MAEGADRRAIGVVGVGYVGLVTAVCFADLGNHVICVDVSEERIRALRDGRVPIYEPGIERLLERNRDRLEFTLDMAEVFDHAQVVFVCVDRLAADTCRTQIVSPSETTPGSLVNDPVQLT